MDRDLQHFFDTLPTSDSPPGPSARHRTIPPRKPKPTLFTTNRLVVFGCVGASLLVLGGVFAASTGGTRSAIRSYLNANLADPNYEIVSQGKPGIAASNSYDLESGAYVARVGTKLFRCGCGQLHRLNQSSGTVWIDGVSVAQREVATLNEHELTVSTTGFGATIARFQADVDLVNVHRQDAPWWLTQSLQAHCLGFDLTPPCDHLP